MKRNGLIVAVAVALVLSLAAGAFAADVTTKANVVAREMSIAIDKSEVDFGDVERGAKDVVSGDVVTATAVSPDYDYTLTVVATDLGDIPAANIVCKVGDDDFAALEPIQGSAGTKDYAFEFKITEVPETAALGAKTGTITFGITTLAE